MSKIIRRDGCGNVAELCINDRLDQLATLATRLDFPGVAEFPLGSHACHASHAEKMNESTIVSDDSDMTYIKTCFLWLAIALDEGHLEPSQPMIGRMTGWPQRMIFINSLWTDFICWYPKWGAPKHVIPEQRTFYELLDRIFIRHGDRYEIPVLEHCRKTFVDLRQQYERT